MTNACAKASGSRIGLVDERVSDDIQQSHSRTEHVKRFWLTLLFVPLVSSPAGAQAELFSLHGYLKNLAGWMEDPAIAYGTAPGNFQDIVHNRLNFRMYPSSALVLACDVRTQFIYQENLNPNRTYSAQIRQAEDMVNLSRVLIDGRDAVLVTQVDRLNLDWTSGPLQITAGRQRIAWGTALVWNPTDIFNPYSILDFDYEERPGVDGIRAQYFTGPTSKVELAVAPGETSLERRVAGLLRFNFREYDFNFMGGFLQGGYFAGFSWAGQIADGGFRGEVRWTGNQETAGSTFLPADTLSYLTASLSADYTFSSSIYLHAEVLFNGDGVSENAGLHWPAATARLQLSPSRWSLYGEVSGELSPLVRGSLYSLINPLDGSFIVVPSLSWSVVTDWDLLAIGLFPSGGTLSEFGILPATALVRVKWSF